MDILVKNNSILATATRIEFGKFDEDPEKWALYNENDDLMYYFLNSDFTLIQNVTLPSDYIEGKYFYIDNEFVLNEDWKPYKLPEERLEELEQQNQSLQEQNDMLLECLLEMSEIVYGG